MTSKSLSAVALMCALGCAAPAFGQAADATATTGQKPRPAGSENESKENEPDSKATGLEAKYNRGRKWLEDLQRKGLTPWLGTIMAGSSFAAGATYERPRIGTFPIGFAVDGKISVHRFSQAGLRVGYLADRRSTAELRPSDTMITSMFGDARPESKGVAAYVEHRYRRLPSLTLFGTDAASELVGADYGISGTTTDAVLQWQPVERIGIALRVGSLAFGLRPGENDEKPDVPEVFDASLATQRLQRARYTTSGVGVMWDRRNNIAGPTAGTVLAVAGWYYASRSPQLPSFTRVSVDARAFRALHGPAHVLAVRGLASMDASEDDRPVPFFLMPSMGGGSVMRGYPDYSLRGDALLSASVEYRWRVWRFVEVAPFVDMGRVARPLLRQDISHWLATPGIGARVRTSTGVLVRADVAHGPAGLRLSFTINTPF